MWQTNKELMAEADKEIVYYPATCTEGYVVLLDHERR